MNLQIKNLLLGILVMFIINVNGIAQQYDILIKDGHVIDAKNNINGTMDVAIVDGKIALVRNQIANSEEKKNNQRKMCTFDHKTGKISTVLHVFMAL